MKRIATAVLAAGMSLALVGGSAGRAASSSPSPPFYPSMPLASFNAAKQDAAARSKPRPVRAGALSQPSKILMNFAGLDESTSGGFIPPDTEGGVGTSNYVEIVNSYRRVFSKSTGATLQSKPLYSVSNPSSSYFNTTSTLVDPRTARDPLNGRWITTAISDPHVLPQYLFVAASPTTDATSTPCVVRFQVSSSSGGVTYTADFDQLGVNTDAGIVTFNVPGTDGSETGSVWTFPKSDLYGTCANLTTSAKKFSNLSVVNIAPPIVLDSNTKAFLVAAPAVGSTLKMFVAQGLSSASTSTLTALPDVSVPDYSLPANAGQCGTNTTLMTYDSRFVNASTQVGNVLWQAHTVAYDSSNSIPTPRFYEINTSTEAVIQTGQFFFGGTTNDFNASIAANSNGDAFVSWTATDPSPTGCRAPDVVFSGRQVSDPLGQMGSGTELYVSPGYYSLGDPSERWGDYSAVSIDPSAYGTCAAGQRAWIVNETAPSHTLWGSRIGQVGFC